MPRSPQTTAQKRANARAKVAELKQLKADLLQRLEAERAQGTPTLEDLESRVTEAEEKVVVLEQRLEEKKTASRQFKAQIAEWKTWYETVAEERKEQEFAKLKSEIDWRAEKIVELEAEITELYSQQLQFEGGVEFTLQSMAAFHEGVYERPLKEDPRIKELSRRISQSV